MPVHDLTIDRFEASEVDGASFTHEAHVYVAWLYLREHETAEAIERFDRALRRLVDKLGAHRKYSAMITWLFMKLIAERMRAQESWAAFRARNVDLLEQVPRPSTA